MTASAGVAPNKFLAKIASGWKKPDGLTVIAPDRVEAFVRGLPVDALWGVGPKTAARLREHGLHTLADVRDRPLDELQALVGSLADWLVALSHGEDDRPVEPNRPTKQSGSECTYAEDLTALADIPVGAPEPTRGLPLDRAERRAVSVLLTAGLVTSEAAHAARAEVDDDQRPVRVRPTAV